MKKKIFILLMIVILITGCKVKKIEEDINLKVKSIGTNIVQVPTYTKVYDEEINERINKKIDGWNYDTDYSITKEGCTAVTKVLDNGDTVMGRNMDLTVTDSPEFVFYISEEGKYKSFNISYASTLGLNYSDLIENGITYDDYNKLPYMITDAINEYGLVMEVNMRSDEYDLETGDLIFGVSGTNPNAKIRTYENGAIRYVIDHAKNVDEALEILGAVNYYTNESYGEGVLDIYCLYTKSSKWNYAVAIADAEGNFGLIEFVDNKVVYYPNQKYQANYYIGDIYNEQELYGAGYGRTELIEDTYDSLSNINDVMSLMYKLRYSNSYKDNSLFDIKSEYVGMDVFSIIELLEKYKNDYSYTLPDYSNLYQNFYNIDTGEYVKITKDNYKDYDNLFNIWSSSYVSDDDKNEDVKLFINWYSEFYNSLTIGQIKNIGIFWNTMHSVLYNSTKKYAIVTFFEDDTKTYTFTFDNIDF